jgi:hypothetical protein
MAVAIVMDFPGGKREQYDQVIEGMDLGGRMPAGGITHSAGATGEGWRVVDIWESIERFQRFAEDQIKPLTKEAGLAEPRMRVVELHNYETADGGEAKFVQVFLIDMEPETYDEVHSQIARPLPDGAVWHGAGISGDVWCIVDAWTSKDKRDRFINEVAMPALQARDDVGGPPRVEELDVQATLREGERARA